MAVSVDFIGVAVEILAGDLLGIAFVFVVVVGPVFAFFFEGDALSNIVITCSRFNNFFSCRSVMGFSSVPTDPSATNSKSRISRRSSSVRTGLWV